jgi:hypothetical protein
MTRQLAVFWFALACTLAACHVATGYNEGAVGFGNPPRIAIIGAGMGGAGAAWFLRNSTISREWEVHWCVASRCLRSLLQAPAIGLRWASG